MKKMKSLAVLICMFLLLSSGAQAAVGVDRAGTPIELPASIERIACFGPSCTEILSALGVADRLVAVDTYSANVEGAEGLPMFDMMTPDAERILSLAPDVLFVTGMSQADSEDPYKSIRDAGVCVLYVPSSNSIEGIKEDIRYIAAVVEAADAGEEIIARMEAEIAAISAIGETIAEKKTVYFEISAAPYLYSFGSGVFLHEMIELIGAKNAFADQDAWIAVTDEAVLAQNPDVILTSVNYIDNPTDEIMSRPSWDAIAAVRNGQVYAIDPDASNRPSQNIVKGLWEMALAVYPALYQDALPQWAGE